MRLGILAIRVGFKSSIYGVFLEKCVVRSSIWI
jgi:hypothetical protein